MITREELNIRTLGPCRIASPLRQIETTEEVGSGFIDESGRLLLDDVIFPDEDEGTPLAPRPSLERAGPRETIYFDPSKTRAGIVTCGGLCPGINDVVRSIVLALWNNYGVRTIYGFRNGYQGFIPSYGLSVLDLNPEMVDGWQELGGTKLGSSRGHQPPAEIVDCLERMGVNMLFVIGGDGTMKGALAISREIHERNLKISIVGVPKTIDNDILFLDESFGYQTAFSAAVEAIQCAHVEAKGTPNGIGLVRVMGRDSGFIACSASLAMSDVNFVLIPEVPFVLEGEGGFLEVLHRRLLRREHAVIVVAEGAGGDLLQTDPSARDASGNARMGDIGQYLKAKIAAHFEAIGFETSVKYIDPSYIIRSVPANAYDSVYCMCLGHEAVHAAMAGKTEMLVGQVHRRMVHIPMQVVTTGRKKLSANHSMWRLVLETTGQPPRFE